MSAALESWLIFSSRVRPQWSHSEQPIQLFLKTSASDICSIQSYINQILFSIFTEAVKLKDTIGTSICRKYQAIDCILCWFVSQTVSNHKTFRCVRTGMTPLWRGMGVGCNKGVLNLSFPEVWWLWRLNVALESSFCCLRCSVRCLDQTPHAACSLWQIFHTWQLGEKTEYICWNFTHTLILGQS